jgi:hypothetical protein
MVAYYGTYPLDLPDHVVRVILIRHGQNPDFEPRGTSFGTPSSRLRNWVCAVDGHSDPDNSGLCIHCSVLLVPDDEDFPDWFNH